MVSVFDIILEWFIIDGKLNDKNIWVLTKLFWKAFNLAFLAVSIMAPNSSIFIIVMRHIQQNYQRTELGKNSTFTSTLKPK